MPECEECGAPFAKPPKGLKRFCSTRCRLKVWRRERHAQDPEKVRGEWREAHHKNREKRLPRMRANYEKNRAAIRQQVKGHRKIHGERLRAIDRARWSGERREASNQMRRESNYQTRLNAPWHLLLKAAKGRAKKYGLPFSLTDEWARSRWTGFCEISGLPFSLGQRKSGPKTYSPSIDQIKPRQGYTPENCRFVIWAVNALKHDGSDEDVYRIAKAICDKTPYTSET